MKMVERETVIDKLRLTYEGLFVATDLYQMIDNWFRQKAYDKRENKNLQKKSEGVWIDRITPSPAINNSLLIAGGEHINNGYGLITRLRRKGIIVNPLVPSDYYDVIGRKIYRESKRKK